MKYLEVKMNIAWIGTGVMGSAMAKNLAKNGHNVSVFSRTISKCEPLKEFDFGFNDLAMS